ncbi:RAMP superfamily CRISPR-associated protein [Sulfurihydrogenibium subterraneum]|uniref:RAMP superfamily CRISPR-associated protein n=1 Tax=Sulfurihydrogenibium subterraneum TaxID=171121 RepID=UPI00048E1BFA|nr:RAMP superfamily CRISPR-associated protein [Sulfurihydrogenibium subterraneum]
MAKKQVEITFKTITPLWTGDAWGDNKEIKPSSLIGSLRFWFEVICYFSGLCEIKRDKNGVISFKEGRFEKEVNRKDFQDCLLREGSDFQAKIKCLLEQEIPLPSIIFGTTNWKSLIEIENIENIKEFDNYRFPTGKIDFPELEHNNRIPVWYFEKGFYGDFTVIFNVEEEIIEPIFFPLLTFMDKYGFWGGKWNIGYGRLEIKRIEENEEEIEGWRREELNFSIFHKYKKINFTEFIEFENEFENLTKKENKIRVLHPIGSNSDFKEIIKILIQQKSQERASFRENDEERHKIFGKTGNPKQMPYVPQGSKILPYIYKEGKEFKGGFLSIVGLLNLD